MIDHNRRVQERLLEVLSHGRAVLVLGAGSSKLVGYPVWSEFVTTLQLEFAPHLPERAENWEEAADEILQQIGRDDRTTFHD
jgi:hypothetical protein